MNPKLLTQTYKPYVFRTEAPGAGSGVGTLSDLVVLGMQPQTNRVPCKLRTVEVGTRWRCQTPHCFANAHACFPLTITEVFQLGAYCSLLHTNLIKSATQEPVVSCVRPPSFFWHVRWLDHLVHILPSTQQTAKAIFSRRRTTACRCQCGQSYWGLTFFWRRVEGVRIQHPPIVDNPIEKKL